MGLSTDSLFIAAISADSEVMEAIGGRLYSTAIPLPDEAADNVPLPYVIVTFDGMTNDTTTKDDLYESDCDTVTVSVIVASESRSALADLMTRLRDIIHDYLVAHQDDSNESMDDYNLTATSVDYDPFRPCYWQTLRYQCYVQNQSDNEQD